MDPAQPGQIPRPLRSFSQSFQHFLPVIHCQSPMRGPPPPFDQVRCGRVAGSAVRTVRFTVSAQNGPQSGPYPARSDLRTGTPRPQSGGDRPGRQPGRDASSARHDPPARGRPDRQLDQHARRALLYHGAGAGPAAAELPQQVAPAVAKCSQRTFQWVVLRASDEATEGSGRSAGPPSPAK